MSPIEHGEGRQSQASMSPIEHSEGLPRQVSGLPTEPPRLG
ncbi:hypothetical protein [Sandaracinus amylolyticus]|nr:hypothetical protein [Sandaracinus amylolyticus]UJR82003.1 Hypothetical protein I5071_40680 [Sandaracinus amylolyticus]